MFLLRRSIKDSRERQFKTVVFIALSPEELMTPFIHGFERVTPGSFQPDKPLSISLYSGRY